MCSYLNPIQTGCFVWVKLVPAAEAMQKSNNRDSENGGYKSSSSWLAELKNLHNTLELYFIHERVTSAGKMKVLVALVILGFLTACAKSNPCAACRARCFSGCFGQPSSCYSNCGSACYLECVGPAPEAEYIPQHWRRAMQQVWE